MFWVMTSLIPGGQLRSWPSARASSALKLSSLSSSVGGEEPVTRSRQRKQKM